MSSFSSDGIIADRIVHSLKTAGPPSINRLIASEKLLVPQTPSAFSYRQLLYEHIEDYAQECGIPLSYYFFGTPEPPTPGYTPYDKLVIYLLNGMTDEQYAAAQQAATAFFPTPLAQMKMELTPDQKVMVLLRTQPQKENYNEGSDFNKIENDVDAAIYAHFKRKRFWFPTDVMPDIATAFGVSLHWLFGFDRLPLYCNNAKADNLFDHYTLLPRSQKHSFIRMLTSVVGGAVSLYDREVYLNGTK